MTDKRTNATAMQAAIKAAGPLSQQALLVPACTLPALILSASTLAVTSGTSDVADVVTYLRAVADMLEVVPPPSVDEAVH